MKNKNISYNKYALSVLTTFCAGVMSGNYASKTIMKDKDLQIEVKFSPKDDCTGKIISEISKAKKQILIQTYSFTCPKITNALYKKLKQGIEIIIIADKSQSTNLSLKQLKKHGAKILIDEISGIAHNKVMIIDNKTVLTGSFNFSNAAQTRNAENSITVHSIALAKIYTENFWNRYNKSYYF